jgi:hypothetical protein
MWKKTGKTRKRRILKKMDQTGIKLNFYIKVVVLVTVIVGLITGIIALVEKCTKDQTKEKKESKLSQLEDQKEKQELKSSQLEEWIKEQETKSLQLEEQKKGKESKLPQIEEQKNEKDKLPLPPPLPEKTEYLKLTVTPTETVSGSAFDGDVKIELTKVHVYGWVSVEINVISSREMLSLEKLDKRKYLDIGSYEIKVNKIERDSAEFRIVRKQR